MSVDHLQLSLKIAIFFKLYSGNFTATHRIKNYNSFFFFPEMFCAQNTFNSLWVQAKLSKLWVITQKQKVFSLAKSAEGVKNRAVKIKNHVKSQP